MAVILFIFPVRKSGQQSYPQRDQREDELGEKS